MSRRAFTLVELLVTITIIAMLAGLSLLALGRVQEAAKADRTKATIAKIDTFVVALYDGYRERRLPCNLTASHFQALPTQQTAELCGRRLDAIRDLMRLELPDHWTDVTADPLSFLWTVNPSTSASQPWLPQRPSLTMRYRAQYIKYRQALVTKGYTTTQAEDILREHESAKLLYMIVMFSANDAREHFRGDEIARPSLDGLPVFVDGWGNPIHFLRWAPGLDQSDIQAVVSPYDDATARLNASTSLENRDPYNPNHVFRVAGMLAPVTTEAGTPSGGNAIPIGWKLTPCVCSAGPDGLYDVQTGDSSYQYAGNPYAVFGSAGSGWGLGSPGGDGRYDNISNHMAAVR